MKGCGIYLFRSLNPARCNDFNPMKNYSVLRVYRVEFSFVTIIIVVSGNKGEL